MKFGIAKFCIPLDLDVLGCKTNSGVDDRYGLIKELLKRGHEVILFTPLVSGYKNDPKEERWLLETKEEDLPENLRFIKQLGYAPTQLPVGDWKVDVLLTEAGVGNFMYSNKYYHSDEGNYESSFVRRFVQIINAHTGPVFHLHNDPSLPFYLEQLALREYPWGHPKNGYTNPVKENRNYPGWVQKSGWGTFEEIFAKDKTNIILTRAMPEHWEYMIDVYDMSRAGYKKLKDNLKFEYQPPAYDYSLCDHLEFQNEIKYPLFYSGGDRHRRRSFREYFEDIGVPTYVSGKWKDEARQAFEGINFLGWVEDRKALYDLVNKAGAMVQIQPKKAARMGWWTARPFEGPACKTMCFMDSKINGAENLVFDKWFVLKNKDDAQKKISSFVKMRNFDRKRIIETQLEYCKTLFTWEKFVDSLIGYCYKYMDKKEVVRKEREKYSTSVIEYITNMPIKTDDKKLLVSGFKEEIIPETKEVINEPIKEEIHEETIKTIIISDKPFTDIDFTSLSGVVEEKGFKDIEL